MSLKSLATDSVRVGIFDISFYKVDQLIPESLTPETIMTPHSLYSPHGAAVASLIFNPEYGGSPHGKLLLMNTGIYYDDFYQGIQKAIELKVQVINVSLTLIDSSIAELINEASRDHGILFVVSAGNAAERRGRSLPDYYKNLRAIVASCIDLDGELPSFAQLDSSVDVLAPCGRSNVRTQIYELRRGVMDYAFGATSSAAPQVVSFVINHLHENKDLTFEDFKLLLKSKAQSFYPHEGVLYPVLNNTQSIMMAEVF
jgi:subtilisin family serine protease